MRRRSYSRQSGVSCTSNCATVRPRTWWRKSDIQNFQDDVPGGFTVRPPWRRFLLVPASAALPMNTTRRRKGVRFAVIGNALLPARKQWVPPTSASRTKKSTKPARYGTRRRLYAALAAIRSSIQVITSARTNATRRSPNGTEAGKRPSAR